MRLKNYFAETAKKISELKTLKPAEKIKRGPTDQLTEGWTDKVGCRVS